MSQEYAERRIKEALRLAQGNNLKALQQVIAWTYEDTKLLHALAKPHLNGIVAYNIERVASGRSEKSKKTTAPVRQAAQTSRDGFGMEILKAVVSDNAAVFGLDDTPSGKRGVSQAHVDAILQIAERSKTKK